jgi:hypothetical protein
MRAKLNNKAKVLEIARAARKWTEEFAIKNPHIGDPVDLSSYCAIAAGKLCSMLQEAGVDAKIANNDSHAFVLVDDYIVDITATQFGAPKKVMLVTAKMGTRFKWFWEIDKVHLNKTAFRSSQRLQGWPRCQWAR